MLISLIIALIGGEFAGTVPDHCPSNQHSNHSLVLFQSLPTSYSEGSLVPAGKCLEKRIIIIKGPLGRDHLLPMQERNGGLSQWMILSLDM